MNELSRRQFIQATALAVPLLKNIADIQFNNKSSSEELIAELALLHKAWLQSTNLKPAVYLEQFPLVTWSNSALIKDLISNEFKSNYRSERINVKSNRSGIGRTILF